MVAPICKRGVQSTQYNEERRSGRTSKGDDRDAHVEGFAGGRGACVGEGV